MITQIKNKNITAEQATELITDEDLESLVKEMVFSRSKTIKRIIELQKSLWIPMHQDKKEYFEEMDDDGLKRQLSMHEYAFANKV